MQGHDYFIRTKFGQHPSIGSVGKAMCYYTYICISVTLNTFLHKINVLLYLTIELWPSGYDGGLVIWRPCRVGGSNPTVDKIFL